MPSGCRQPDTITFLLEPSAFSDNTWPLLNSSTIAKNAASNHIHKPQEINQALANAIQNNVIQGFKGMMSTYGSSEFLDARELTKDLKEIEELGVFDHITAKSEIRDLERITRHPGKKPSSEDDRDLGGKPSAYPHTKEFEKLKNVMEKPGAIQLFYQKIAKSDLAYGLVKYQLLAFWHAAKMDETVLANLIGSSTTFFPNELSEEDIPDFKTVYQRLQLLDERELDELAHDSTKILLENIDYQKFIIFMFGLPGLAF